MRCCGCESTNIQPCPSATPRAISTARRPAPTPCPRTCGGSCAGSGCCETVTRDLFFAVFLVVRKLGEARLMSACPPTTAQKRTFNHFGFVPILLQKSQLQDLEKSAQSRVTSTIDCCPPRNHI